MDNKLLNKSVDGKLTERGSNGPSSVVSPRNELNVPQSKKEKDLTNTLNLHKNFENLNPIYDKLRFGRAQDLAAHWVERISDKLKQDVKNEKRKNFLDFLS